MRRVLLDVMRRRCYIDITLDEPYRTPGDRWRPPREVTALADDLAETFDRLDGKLLHVKGK